MRISAAGSSAALALILGGATGCASGPITTAHHATTALTPECSVAVDGERALVDVGLRIGGALAPLGDGDLLAARVANGPISLLRPYIARHSFGDDGGAWKKYEAIVSGLGAPSLGWSRGPEPYTWVALPLPPVTTLAFTKQPTPTVTWTTDANDAAPETLGLQLHVACLDAGGCSRLEHVHGTCWADYEVKPAGGSKPLVELIPAASISGGALDRCNKIRVAAIHTRTTSIGALGFPSNALCTTTREVHVDLDRSDR